MMPRRNRNASTSPSPDLLADQITHLAADLAAPLCAACRVNLATCGDYCALCKGLITTTARHATLTRR